MIYSQRVTLAEYEPATGKNMMTDTDVVTPIESSTKTILVVDDEESIRKTLKYMLEQVNYCVHTAEHAAVALEILNKNRIDLVISDIVMPEISGLELVEQIKKLYHPPEILLITGDPSLETATSAVQLGVFDYISKPLKKRALLDVVHRALEKKELLYEKERLQQQNRRYLQDLEEKLDQNTYRLHLSEEKYRSLFENTNVGIGIADLHGNVIDVNPAMCRITGFSEKNFRKTKLDSTIVDPNSLVELTRILKKNRTVDNFEVELFRANGSTYWASISTRVISFKTQTGVLTTLIEITDRKEYELSLKKALADKEEMLREIHHRTKNNMNVIISLLNMQSYSSSNKQVRDILEKVNDRIFSMSLIHEQIYLAKEFSSIDLPLYVNSLLMRHYSSTEGSMQNIQIEKKLDEVRIGLSKALPLGLALNEILANVVKHPFAPETQGQITINVNSLPNQSIQIIVRDNGKGFPEDLDLLDPPTLGLHMVKILIEDQLGGSLLLSSDQGARVEIKFPLDIGPEAHHN